jgi:hypothetical protein
MPRFGDSDMEPLACTTNVESNKHRKATEAKRQLAAPWGDPPLDHHIEELLAALGDLSPLQDEAGADTA